MAISQKLLWKWLTLSWRRSLSNINQSTELLWNTIGWFLYDRDLLHVNGLHNFKHLSILSIWWLGMKVLIALSSGTYLLRNKYEIYTLICPILHWKSYRLVVKTSEQQIDVVLICINSFESIQQNIYQIHLNLNRYLATVLPKCTLYRNKLLFLKLGTGFSNFTLANETCSNCNGSVFIERNCLNTTNCTGLNGTIIVNGEVELVERQCSITEEDAYQVNIGITGYTGVIYWRSHQLVLKTSIFKSRKLDEKKLLNYRKHSKKQQFFQEVSSILFKTVSCILLSADQH